MSELQKLRFEKRNHYSSETDNALTRRLKPQYSDLFTSVLNLDSTSAFLIVLDGRGLVKHMNPSFQKASSHGIHETAGTYFCESLIASEDRERIHDHLHKAARNQSPQKFSATFLYKDGTRHKLDCSLLSLIDRKGDVEFMVLLAIEPEAK